MEKDIIATESFSHHNKTYFFDYMQAANGSNYIKISRSDRQPDDTFKKQEVVVFEENFEFMLEAMSSLFRTAGYQQALKPVPVKAPDLFRTSGIKSWDPECRPREKLAAHGRESMADAELLAMLIGSGSPRETAVALAGRLLSSVDFSLARLAALTIEELCAFRGMGHAKSSSVIAAMELAKRLVEEQALLVNAK